MYQLEVARSAGVRIIRLVNSYLKFGGQIVTVGKLSHEDNCFGGLIILGGILFWGPIAVSGFLTGLHMIQWPFFGDFYLGL